ncbi:MAG: DNA replication and repair protein RecF [Candidatus Atribacteria bacterium]|nr:DNA replication and repair protein RecF [Candidatus Atribacteria bacterium]
MLIRELKCIHWRNLEKINLCFSDHLIILQGENAQGKTNLLEAIYFLSRGCSFRRAKDQEMVAWGENYSYLGAKVVEDGTYFWKEVSVHLGHKKEWKINGHPRVRKQGIWLVGYFPSDHEIVTGPPQKRREYIDEAIGFIYSAHTALVNQYEGLLSRRNYLLRGHASEELIETYTKKLIQVGKKIIKGRIEYLRLYTPFIKNFYSRLGMNNQSLFIKYQPIGYHLDGENEIYLEKGFEKVKEEEREREVTLIGPHRDEIVFEKEGREFRTFGSQGEKKSLVLSIKLAEMSVIQLIKKSKAIMIFDDVFSELDQSHQDLLLEEILNQGQVFISTTQGNESWRSRKKNHVTVFLVEKGKIKMEK